MVIVQHDHCINISWCYELTQQEKFNIHTFVKIFVPYVLVIVELCMYICENVNLKEF